MSLTYVSFDVRPVLEMKDSCESYQFLQAYRGDMLGAIESGHSFKTYWTIYGIDGEGLATAIGDFDTGEAATGIAKALAGSAIDLVTVTGRAPHPVTSWDQDDVATALCIWEAMLADHGNTKSPMRHLWESIGAVAMRDVAMMLAGPANRLWESVEGWHGNVTFDWEWIPALMGYVDWTARVPYLLPGARESMLGAFPIEESANG